MVLYLETIPIPNPIAKPIPNPRGLAIAAPSYGGPSPSVVTFSLAGAPLNGVSHRSE